MVVFLDIKYQSFAVEIKSQVKIEAKPKLFACTFDHYFFRVIVGERRIRVHTLALPVSPNVHDIINSADQQAIVGLLSKMAVDRSLTSSIKDSREAFINVLIDSFTTYKATQIAYSGTSLIAPTSLHLLPLYILALLKTVSLKYRKF